MQSNCLLAIFLVFFLISYGKSFSIANEDHVIEDSLENTDDTLTLRTKRDGNDVQFQQWQVAVVVPPGTQQGSKIPQVKLTNRTPSSNSVWIRVPNDYTNAQRMAGMQSNDEVSETILQNNDGGQTNGETTPETPKETNNEANIAGTTEIVGTTQISLEEMELVKPEIVSASDSALQHQRGLLSHCKAKRGQFPSPFSCRRFINCWDDSAVEQNCPLHTLFNSKKKICDYPENVDCGNRPVDPKEPMCSRGNDYYPHPKNCNQFYVCLRFRPILQKCPKNLHFNSKYKVCDYPYSAGCVGRPFVSEDQNSLEEEESRVENY